LSLAGLTYVDRVSGESRAIRTQPKIITMLLIQNSEGDILLQRRSKQPYIDAWTLPYGKLHIDDLSVVAAGQREALEKLGLKKQPMKHVGDCYIRVALGPEILSATLAHVCAFNTDAVPASNDIVWARPHKLRNFPLAPAVEEIVARGFFNDPFFFEEFDVSWEL
jgi:ADP-ribose pyrophosphatase YjhB (NUDIX family)